VDIPLFSFCDISDTIYFIDGCWKSTINKNEKQRVETEARSKPVNVLQYKK